MRPADWPERLAAEIEAARTQPFVWGGETDCWGWVARVVRRLGGPDLKVGMPAYDDPIGAQRAMEIWGETMADAVAACCAAKGLREVSPELAQRGDVLVLELRQPRGEAVQLAAICGGVRAIATGLAGVRAVPMRCAIRAWAV